MMSHTEVFLLGLSPGPQHRGWCIVTAPRTPVSVALRYPEMSDILHMVQQGCCMHVARSCTLRWLSQQRGPHHSWNIRKIEILVNGKGELHLSRGKVQYKFTITIIRL